MIEVGERRPRPDRLAELIEVAREGDAGAYGVLDRFLPQVPPNHCLFLAARALGLDGGPMSGFDNARVDAEFFPAPDGADEVNRAGRWRSNFLVNLGYGDPAQLLWGATNPIPL